MFTVVGDGPNAAWPSAPLPLIAVVAGGDDNRPACPVNAPAPRPALVPATDGWPLTKFGNDGATLAPLGLPGWPVKVLPDACPGNPPIVENPCPTPGIEPGVDRLCTDPSAACCDGADGADDEAGASIPAGTPIDEVGEERDDTDGLTDTVPPVTGLPGPDGVAPPPGPEDAGPVLGPADLPPSADATADAAEAAAEA
jgi:hypothetical protein